MYVGVAELPAGLLAAKNIRLVTNDRDGVMGSRES